MKSFPLNTCTSILKNSFPVGFAVHSDSSVVVMLVGNKSDLAHVREVTVEEGTALAEQHSMSFIETSALESVNVINAFQTVLREIHKIVSRKALAPDATKDNTVLSSGHRLAGSDEMTPRRGGCCSMV
jgi:Ras-related protein Rab-11A